MSTYFKVQVSRSHGNTSVLEMYLTVSVTKGLVPVKSIGFYIVSLVGKVIIKSKYILQAHLSHFEL